MKFLNLVLITLLTISLIGCAQTKEALKRDEVKAGAIGGAIGAGTGAIIGSQTGKAGVGAAIGAGVGILAGTLIGSYMQKQKTELQQVTDKINQQEEKIGNLQTQQAKINSENDLILLNMQGDALFPSGSYALQPGAMNNLREYAAVFKKYPDTTLTVKGYTDSIGDDNYNMRLSQDRAESVKNFLLGEGIDPQRMTSIGYGEAVPVASNETPEGRQLNRRVEIVVRPNQQREG